MRVPMVHQLRTAGASQTMAAAVESAVKRAARLLIKAEAVLITAGAGMGVDSGTHN